MVFQLQCLQRDSDMVVMSGDVGCWFGLGGMRVEVSVFSTLCVEFCRMFAISSQ